MSTNTMYVHSVGMLSSLSDAKNSSASSRAGITRACPTDFEIEVADEFEMVPISGYPAYYLTQGFTELGRLSRLGGFALQDLFINAADSGAGGSEEIIANAAFVLNLASGYYQGFARQSSSISDGEQLSDDLNYEDLKPLYAENAIPQMLLAAGIRRKPQIEKVVFAGDAGFSNVLTIANNIFETTDVAYCIVGGVDSMLEPDVIEATLQLGILKTENNAIGFMPGEGAAFLLLTKSPKQQSSVTEVAGVFLEKDQASDFSNNHSFLAAQGLSKTILRALQLSSDRNLQVFGNLNGTRDRAVEWSNCMVRLSAEMTIAEDIYPIASFGEIGAAYGFFSMVIAHCYFQEGYSNCNETLIWAISENGFRASVLLRHS